MKLKFEWLKLANPQLVELLYSDIKSFLSLGEAFENGDIPIFYINGRKFSSSFYHFMRLTKLEDYYSLFELACFYGLFMQEAQKINEFQCTLLNIGNVRVRKTAKFALEEAKKRVLERGMDFFAPNPELSISFGDDPRGATIYINGIKDYEQFPLYIPRYCQDNLEKVFDDLMTRDEY